MSKLIRGVWFIVGLTLAAFSLPAAAGGNTNTKYFNAVFPLFVVPGQAFQVKFNNATPPPGVSTINSISITTPNANIKIISGSPGSWTSLGQDPVTGGWIYMANNFTGIKNGQTGTFTLIVSDAAPDACISGTWKAAANTGNSLNGDVFNDNGSQLVTACDGTLACGTTNGGNLDPALDGTPDSGLERGPVNSDGSTCTNAVPYIFRVNFAGTQNATFITIKDNGKTVSASYVMAWNPEDLPASGWTNVQPSVSWGTVGHNPPQPGTTDFVPALVCLSDDLSNPTAIMPTIPDDSATKGPYSSSPYPQFKPGQQAKMCISEHAWALVQVNIGTVDNPNLVWKVQYLDRVIDQSDGVIIKQ